MTITRRALLGSTLALPALLSFGRFVLAAPTARPLLLTLSNVNTGSNLAELSALVEPLMRRDVKLTLTLDPFEDAGQPLDPDSDLVAWIRGMHQRYPDSLEFGIHVDSLPSDGFEQVRAASQAQAGFLQALNAPNFDSAIVMGRVLTTKTPRTDLEGFASMRAAGIGTIIHLATDKIVEVTSGSGSAWEAGPTGLVHLDARAQDSALLEVGETRRLVTSSISDNAGSPGPAVIDLLALTKEMKAASSLGDEVAASVNDLVRAGAFASMLPGGLPAPDGAPAKRYVIVRVDDLRLSPETDVDHEAFIRDLIKGGYPVTDAVIPAPDGWPLSDDEDVIAFLKTLRADARYEAATHGWMHSESELKGASTATDFRLIVEGARQLLDATGVTPASYIPPNNAFDDNTLDAVAAAGIPIFSADKFDFRYCQSVDRRGILHVSNTVMFEKSWDGDCPYFTNQELMSFFGAKNDAVFMIHPQTANTPAKRKQVLDTLKTLASDPGVELVNFSEYRKAVLPVYPTVERIQQARRTVWIEDARVSDISDNERDALKDDAALAWRYFDLGARQFDGLAPGTADMQAGKMQGYPFVTMWDLASHILAAISAHRLGVIDQTGFEATSTRLVKFLGETSFDFDGVRLPQTERAIGKQPSQLRGFDSADTGRLLIALKALDKDTAGSLLIEKLVRGWGLEKTLPGGELHDIADGKLTSAQSNSYTGYAGRGFALWGYEVKPVFDTLDPLNDMSDAVATLAALEDRGRIATEPFVTEEIELGASPHSRLASDILYAAQIDRYRETGKLTCASETALAQKPYFTYQGYQIDGAGGHFVVDEPSLESRKQTQKQQDAFRVVNAKGAYLWHATRPGLYSAALINLVRSTARIEDLGFASGVHEKSGKAVALSEINTNGVILESIAYILNGRTPLI